MCRACWQNMQCSSAHFRKVRLRRSAGTDAKRCKSLLAMQHGIICCGGLHSQHHGLPLTLPTTNGATHRCCTSSKDACQPGWTSHAAAGWPASQPHFAARAPQPPPLMGCPCEGPFAEPTRRTALHQSMPGLHVTTTTNHIHMPPGTLLQLVQCHLMFRLLKC